MAKAKVQTQADGSKRVEKDDSQQAEEKVKVAKAGSRRQRQRSMVGGLHHGTVESAATAATGRVAAHKMNGEAMIFGGSRASDR